MGEPTRDNLRVRFHYDDYGITRPDGLRKVTDEEFDRIARQEGYVKTRDLIEVQWCSVHRSPATDPKDATCRLEDLTPPLFVLPNDFADYIAHVVFNAWGLLNEEPADDDE